MVDESDKENDMPSVTVEKDYDNDSNDDDDIVDVEELESNNHHSLPESAEDLKLHGTTANGGGHRVPVLVAAWKQQFESQSPERRKRIWMVGGSLALVVVVLILVVSASSSSNNKNPPPMSSRMEEMVDFLTEATNGISTRAALQDSKTPQYMAAHWLADMDSYTMATTDTPSTTDIGTTDSNDAKTSLLQRYALTVLYFALGGQQWEFDTIFGDPTTSECDWSEAFSTTTSSGSSKTFDMGVTCNGYHHVEELRLPGNKLNGQLPPEIGLLTHLHHLSLYGNEIRGSLPTEMANLSNLRFLSLGSNGITGSLPSYFGTNYKDLKYLELSHNQMIGSLPSDSMLQMTSLLELAIDDNMLMGTMGFLNDMPKLRQLFLSENLFEDTLDDTFLNKLSLHALDLSDNNLQGSIPKHFFQGSDAKHLKSLDLSKNTLTGELPDFADDDYALQYLSLAQNQLRGEIGKSIWDLEGLTHLDLSDNEFSGPFPGYAIAWMKNLTFLFLANNDFEAGHFPLFYDMVNLRELSLKNTNRIGTIPHYVAHNLTELVLLDLDNNALTGTIPANLGHLSKLEFLLLNRNQLSGTVPSNFDRLESIAMLLLHDNKFTGNTNHFCANMPEGLQFFASDCGGSDPALDCTCCTVCCEAGHADCVRGDLLASFDGVRYENDYQRTEYVFSEDLVFRTKAAVGEET